MIMADVFAVFGTLLVVGIALPGLLLTLRLLFPKIVNRAEQRLTQTPWKNFFVGGICLVIYLIPVIILFNLPWEIFPVLGLLALFVLAAIASLGAAGLAGALGQRLNLLGVESSTAGSTIRGAVAMELAAIFPFIGWFIFIPVTFTFTLGAAIFALFGWMPRAKPEPKQTPDNTDDTPPQIDIRQTLHKEPT
jgi:hypothetical protein